MSENLARASTILLFGRVVEDIQINTARGSGASAKRAAKSASLGQQGASHALADQVAAEGSCLARIYAFSYEGHYYDLARPALFLVHGPGVDADPVPGTPANVDRSGVGATAKTFPGDMKVWAYDKGDFSIRLDVETGTLEQILLHVELSTDRLGMTFSGKTVRLRGPLGVGD